MTPTDYVAQILATIKETDDLGSRLMVLLTPLATMLPPTMNLLRVLEQVRTCHNAT